MVRIFVEGKGDEHFLQKYLDFLSEGVNFLDYQIISTGGWTKIDKLDNQFKENSDLDGTNLIIFDADSPENEGGFQPRQDAINAKKGELNINFELFLFPNNTDDGDFELLLERIINERHSGLLACFSQYENCIEAFENDEGNNLYSLPIRKAKIYSYIDAFPKSKRQNEKFKKGDFFFSNPEYWNLTSDNLVPLKEFLLRYLQPII